MNTQSRRPIGVSLEGISDETALARWEVDPVLRAEFWNDRAVYEAYIRNRGSFKGIKTDGVVVK